MDSPNTNTNTQIKPDTSRNLSYPDQLRDQTQQLVSTIKLLAEIPKSISTLRRVFRGEALFQSDGGKTEWIQVVKPMFIRLDPITRKPLKQTVLINNEEVETYIPNDEAIEEILSELYFMGVNQITPITFLDEDTILDDLKEFECKLAGVLMQKQVSWGLDKALMPMIMMKIKTIIADIRFMCRNGITLKALTQSVSRIEQVLEQTQNKKANPYQ